MKKLKKQMGLIQMQHFICHMSNIVNAMACVAGSRLELVTSGATPDVQ